MADDYRRGAVFKQFGIDFCCGGGRTVEEACARKGVDIEALESALKASDLPRGDDRMPDPRGWDPGFLADYIVQVHHTYCRESLPVLRNFAAKVARVHGPHTPALLSVDRAVQALSEEMDAHMAAEEDEVFPAIRAGEGASAALGQMEEEHEADLHRHVHLENNVLFPAVRGA